MSTDRIGWALVERDFVIKAGSSGAMEFVIGVTQQDGSALPTYDGFTALISFKSPFTMQTALSKSPTVTGDGVAKTLTFDLVFVPADTLTLAPAKYDASVWISDPTDSGMYVPASITLTVEPHD